VIVLLTVIEPMFYLMEDVLLILVSIVDCPLPYMLHRLHVIAF
jgi:hypothetical protein